MRGFAVHFTATLVMAYVDLSFVLPNSETRIIQWLIFLFKIIKIKVIGSNIYCLPSPSLQLGQVQATRRRRGLVGLALPVDVSPAPITTSMPPPAPAPLPSPDWEGDESCWTLLLVPDEATVTSWVPWGAWVVTTCHLVGSLGSCWSCWPAF